MALNIPTNMLTSAFFDRDASEVAKALLGKVICAKYKEQWLKAQIIETEAYYLAEKGSHASLGYTQKRKALFMPPGTIYMYYARGGDSLNISCRRAGNAVLIKSAFPYNDHSTPPDMLEMMQQLNPCINPARGSQTVRPVTRLCAGQTLLCCSLNLKVPEWNQKTFDPERFYFADVGYQPEFIIQTRRLGIPVGRDEHLPYRFIDYAKAKYCTSNPLTKRSWQADKDYCIIQFT